MTSTVQESLGISKDRWVIVGPFVQCTQDVFSMILQWDESFDIGSDTLTGVNDADYQPPFRFTRTLNKLMIKLDRPQLSAEDIKSFEAAMRTKAVSE